MCRSYIDRPDNMFSKTGKMKGNETEKHCFCIPYSIRTFHNCLDHPASCRFRCQTREALILFGQITHRCMNKGIIDLSDCNSVSFELNSHCAGQSVQSSFACIVWAEPEIWQQCSPRGGVDDVTVFRFNHGRQQLPDKSHR